MAYFNSLGDDNFAMLVDVGLVLLEWSLQGLQLQIDCLNPCGPAIIWQLVQAVTLPSHQTSGLGSSLSPSTEETGIKKTKQNIKLPCVAYIVAIYKLEIPSNIWAVE